MPNYTETLKLIKPTEDEFYNIAVPNANMDALDSYIKELQEQNRLLREELANKADKENTMLHRQSILEGDDLNAFFLPGYYHIGTSLIAKSLLNKPEDYTNAGMLLNVASSQILTAWACDYPPSGANMWFRNYYYDSSNKLWTPWKRIATL